MRATHDPIYQFVSSKNAAYVSLNDKIGNFPGFKHQEFNVARPHEELLGKESCSDRSEVAELPTWVTSEACRAGRGHSHGVWKLRRPAWSSVSERASLAGGAVTTCAAAAKARLEELGGQLSSWGGQFGPHRCRHQAEAWNTIRSGR